MIFFCVKLANCIITHYSNTGYNAKNDDDDDADVTFKMEVTLAMSKRNMLIKIHTRCTTT